MPNIYVYYASQLVTKYVNCLSIPYPELLAIPEDSYIYYSDIARWYRKITLTTTEALEDVDVPSEIRALHLLMAD